MVNVLLYAIANEMHLMEKWIAPSKQHRLKHFAEKVMAKLRDEKSSIVRSVKIDGLWVYYFQQ
jgi:predicted AAA+ superfamily ATPase